MPDESEDTSDEIIQILGDADTGSQPWHPTVGPETIELLHRTRLAEESQRCMRDEAVAILQKCVAPDGRGGEETGLVVGYVQSGKTMSFTTLAALARDNGYPLVIVIAGTSIPLTNQSRERLRRDLQLSERDDRKWLHIHNPKGRESTRTIADALADWHDPTVPNDERRTVLITVMKHHGRLDHLINVLRNIDLANVPVLLIDDEADQAGLNNLIRQGNESTTYQRLCALKGSLPIHTFLQYTATPQGPLLINIIDVLSPGFAAVLTPGVDYAGGSEFFLGHEQLVRDIPPNEIPTQTNLLREPPHSLLNALRLFFLGVAVGLVRDGGRGNRSMMIHPSQRTIGHRRYYDWIVAIRDNWMGILQNLNDPDRSELIEDFRQAYNDLHETVPGLESFDQLLLRLLHAIRRTELHLINTAQGSTPQIDWSSAYSHILVGGQAMDRGYTVEGLTVTYMPRGVGVGNADTVQQRARFFGYKRPYLGFCRVFLEPAVSRAFHRYVEHEEDVRNRLVKHTSTGRSLNELRRAFLLTRSLRPTRDSIIDIDYVRASFSEGWFSPKAPHDSAQAIATNNRAIERFFQGMAFVLDDGHPDRTETQRHLVVHNQLLELVYKRLLTVLRFSRLNDAQNFLGALVILRRYLDTHPEAVSTIYLMSQGNPRFRTLNQQGEIPTLFQGAAPVNPPERRGEIYPGDGQIRAVDGVTVQIHRLDLSEYGSQEIQYRDVPNMAIYIPREIAGDVIIQNQGNLTEFQ
jgi:hypothetical protein